MLLEAIPRNISASRYTVHGYIIHNGINTFSLKCSNHKIFTFTCASTTTHTLILWYSALETGCTVYTRAVVYNYSVY